VAEASSEREAVDETEAKADDEQAEAASAPELLKVQRQTADCDAGERYVSDWCKAIGATVLVRMNGTIVVRDKRWNTEIGGIEIKRRMEWALARA
jgi:hypothetical protein